MLTSEALKFARIIEDSFDNCRLLRPIPMESMYCHDLDFICDDSVAENVESSIVSLFPGGQISVNRRYHNLTSFQIYKNDKYYHLDFFTSVSSRGCRVFDFDSVAKLQAMGNWNETYAVFLFLARRGHVHKQEYREMALSNLGNDDISLKFFFKALNEHLGRLIPWSERISGFYRSTRTLLFKMLNPTGVLSIVESDQDFIRTFFIREVELKGKRNFLSIYLMLMDEKYVRCRVENIGFISKLLLCRSHSEIWYKIKNRKYGYRYIRC